MASVSGLTRKIQRNCLAVQCHVSRWERFIGFPGGILIGPSERSSLEFLKGRFLNRKRMGAFQQVYAIDRMTKGDYRSDFLADRRIEKFEAADGSEHTGGLNLARKLERTSF